MFTFLKCTNTLCQKSGSVSYLTLVKKMDINSVCSVLFLLLYCHFNSPIEQQQQQQQQQQQPKRTDVVLQKRQKFKAVFTVFFQNTELKDHDVQAEKKVRNS